MDVGDRTENIDTFTDIKLLNPSYRLEQVLWIILVMLGFHLLVFSPDF